MSVQTSIFHSESTSTGHSYSRADWSEAQNKETYGEDYSPEGMGHNFVVTGELLGEQGSTPKFQQSVWRASRLIDHQNLTEGPTTLEWVTEYLWTALKKDWSQQTVVLHVQEGPRLWASFNGDEMQLSFRHSMSCVHKHWNESLTEEENKELYGKCSGLHGHEYVADITLGGELDRASMLLIRRATAWNHIKSLMDPLHGTYLNDVLGNTSGEKIANYLFDQMALIFTSNPIKEVALHETRKNSFFARSATNYTMGSFQPKL